MENVVEESTQRDIVLLLMLKSMPDSTKDKASAVTKPKHTPTGTVILKLVSGLFMEAKVRCSSSHVIVDYYTITPALYKSVREADKVAQFATSSPSGVDIQF